MRSSLLGTWSLSCSKYSKRYEAVDEQSLYSYPVEVGRSPFDAQWGWCHCNCQIDCFPHNPEGTGLQGYSSISPSSAIGFVFRDWFQIEYPWNSVDLPILDKNMSRLLREGHEITILYFLMFWCFGRFKPQIRTESRYHAYINILDQKCVLSSNFTPDFRRYLDGPSCLHVPRKSDARICLNVPSLLICLCLWNVFETFPTLVATLMPSPDRERLSNRETRSSAEWTSIALVHWSTFWNFPGTRWP
jgi:hypothetical protein